MEQYRQQLLMSGILFGFFMIWNICFAQSPYELINPPQPTKSGDKIEVVEIFWYGCPHCYEFEPYLEKWLHGQPEDVVFYRIPGVFANNWVPHAKAFYTAEKLDMLEVIHKPLFYALHAEKREIYDEKQLRKFFIQHGVDREQFDKVYHSQEIDASLKQVFLAGREYKIKGVPSIVVNGRYLVSGTTAGSYQNLIKTVDELVEKERIAAAKTSH